MFFTRRNVVDLPTFFVSIAGDFCLVMNGISENLRATSKEV